MHIAIEKEHVQESTAYLNFLHANVLLFLRRDTRILKTHFLSSNNIQFIGSGKPKKTSIQSKEY